MVIFICHGIIIISIMSMIAPLVVIMLISAVMIVIMIMNIVKVVVIFKVNLGLI